MWRVPVAPPAERQPVTAAIPALVLSGGYDWLTPPSWGRDAAKNLPESRHVIFRSQGHGVSSQDQCAARLRDEFFDSPDPRWPLPCRADTPLDFKSAAERVKQMSRDAQKNR